MPKLHSQDIDPLNTPMEIAEKMFSEQLSAAIDIIVPNRPDPLVRRLHESGLTLKDFQDIENA
jgi:hypothetical protein